MANRKQDAVVPQAAPVRHVVVGPYRNTADAISAIAQCADDDPGQEAVVMRKVDFDQLIAR